MADKIVVFEITYDPKKIESTTLEHQIRSIHGVISVNWGRKTDGN